MRPRILILIVTLGVALIVCLTIVWRARQEMGHMKQEFHEITDANEVLKTHLGDLTLAITQREAEIDRLRSSRCEIPQGDKRDSKPLPHLVSTADPNPPIPW
jgi:hypothetical protein